ncbi:MAG TPA: OmpA family protein [Fluviicola sp.]|nr:OmpA family protein [Fluviicola sp.]
MKKIVLGLFYLFFSAFLFGQTENSESIADCTGAVQLHENGQFQMQFPGNKGKSDDLKLYFDLLSFKEENSLFCYYKAKNNGRLTIKVAADIPVRFVIFQTDTLPICEAIQNGKSTIKRHSKSATNTTGLSLALGPNVFFPLNLKAGDEIMIGFFATNDTKSKLQLDFNFEENADDFQRTALGGKLIDLRINKELPCISILLRDIETGKPVVGNTSVKGIKSITASYLASDIKLQVERAGRIQLKIDAEGYFFLDREEPVSSNSDIEVVIWLEPLGSGKSQNIEEIEFYPGSSEFLSTAEPKLKRLKEFLALNAFVTIEIQGHVHSNGENTLEAQKLSEARAKRVFKYLVDNGIDKNRLKTIGLGNTMPLFPNAKYPSEEQANRRVEIKVL